MQSIEKEKLLKMLDKSNRAFLIYEIDKPIPFYSNKQAIDLYADENEIIHVYDMFETKEASPFLKADIRDELKKAMSVTMYDIATVTNTGEVKLSDLQIGYNNDSKTNIFIELSFKDDNRMSIAKNQIFTSNRAEAILNFDSSLSVVECNHKFCDIFEVEGDARHVHYKNHFINGIDPETRYEKLAEIQSELEHSLSYTTQIKIITVTGKNAWYSLDLQRRFLDDTGEKLMAYLVCIDNQVEIKNKLDDMNDMFNVMQSLSDDLLYRVDVKNKILYRSESTAQLYDLSTKVENFPYDIQKQNFLHPDDVDGYIKFGEQLINGVEGTHIARVKSSSGNYEANKFTFKKLLNRNGTLKEMIGKAVNIQQILQLEEKASYDLLTSTLNKISFEEHTKEILSNAKTGVNYALIFIDLDDFKGVNDNLGHSFGDFMLKNVGERLRRYVRGNDLVGRVGGDEFIILLESRFGEQKLIQRCELILDALHEDYVFDNQTTSIQGSIGVAIYPQHGTTYEELYTKADTALYNSKHVGKNVVSIYNQLEN